MVGKTKTPTADEKRRMTILKEHVSCIPCLLLLDKVRLPSIQHTVSGMTRDGHEHTYSSCDWHHFGYPLEQWQHLPGAAGGAKQATSGLLGPSFAWGRRVFEASFGSERLLVRIATGLVEAFERDPWIDYDVPHTVRRNAIEYWRDRV